jgi:hypothetical protein
MARGNIFAGGSFLGSPRPGMSVRPITLALRSDEIAPGELKAVLRRAVPKGYVGTSPQIIKTLDGEFLLYADGRIEFAPLGWSPSPRFELPG